MARTKKVVEEEIMAIEGMGWQNDSDSFCEPEIPVEQEPVVEELPANEEDCNCDQANEGEAKAESCDRCSCEKKKWLPFEFSKFMVFLCFLIGVASIAAYYCLMYIAITNPGCMIVPDSTLAVSGMTEIVGSVLGYYLYQAFLKNSRNKYNVDEVGKPWENIRWKR